MQELNAGSETGLGLGVGSMVFQERASELGGGQLSPQALVMLSKMKAGETIDWESDLGQEVMEGFHGDTDKASQFKSDIGDLQRVKYARENVMYNDDFADLTTLNGLREFQLDSTDKFNEGAQSKRRRISNTIGAFRGGNVGSNIGNWMTGIEATERGGALKDETGETGAGGLAKYRAALESLQHAAAGQAQVMETMKIAMATQLNFAKDLANSPILEKMSDGSIQLTTSMDGLKDSVDALNQTMGGKIPDRVKQEYKNDTASADAHFDKAREFSNKAGTPELTNILNYTGNKANELYEYMNGYFNLPNQSTQEAVDGINNTLLRTKNK